MDRFSGARHSAFALRRFYPAIYGRNLTHQGSQYGFRHPAACSAYGAEKTQKTTSFFESLASTVGAVGGTLLGNAMEQDALDREAERQAKLMTATAQAEEAKARTVALQTALQQQQGPSALVWVGGGLALVALAGTGIYFATRAPKAAA